MRIKIGVGVELISAPPAHKSLPSCLCLLSSIDFPHLALPFYRVAHCYKLIASQSSHILTSPHQRINPVFLPNSSLSVPLTVKMENQETREKGVAKQKEEEQKG